MDGPEMDHRDRSRFRDVHLVSTTYSSTTLGLSDVYQIRQSVWFYYNGIGAIHTFRTNGVAIVDLQSE